MLARLAPALRALPPETAHRLALGALQLGLAGGRGAHRPGLATAAAGLHFPNPVGLAAGFDKDAVALAPLRRLGFGFIEAGTVTPRPQPGNPRPRLFRLPSERAAINRLGFPSAGLAAFAARLAALDSHAVPVGANLGINKTGADPERDYAALAAAVAPYADYLAINVSSPNTPGLRDLQAVPALRGIVASIRAAFPGPPPLFVKLAPDLADDAFAELVDFAVETGCAGLILTNTTRHRPAGLRGRHAAEAGGLSGPPLAPRALAMLRAAFRRARGRLALIGVGGIRTGADVLARLEAGASLVQLYTAFAYEGPALLPRLLDELEAALSAKSYSSVAAAIGAAA